MKPQKRMIGSDYTAIIMARGLVLIGPISQVASGKGMMFTRNETFQLFFALKEYMDAMEASVPPEVWEDLMMQFEMETYQNENGEEE